MEIYSNSITLEKHHNDDMLCQSSGPIDYISVYFTDAKWVGGGPHAIMTVTCKTFQTTCIYSVSG